tara:strand:+ start:1157 stop:2281 length:1125 start_codon:yes stop_codon:yes gene_type:complete
MKKTIYNYFFSEFLRYFVVVVFALAAIIWTIQAVNFLDLVTDDGHAFRVYLLYTFLAIPKVITKLIPFSFLIASVLTILKFEKDNELIILWTSGLNKIHIVNLLFRISIIFVLIQILMSSFVTPETLNYSRSLLKDSRLQFVPSLLKEKQFNDTVEQLTIFVNKKNPDGTYENIFIRDEGKVLTNISDGSSTIFAKTAYIESDDKTLVLLNGNIQKLEKDNKINVIKFEKTEINLSNLSTKSITEPKIQETSTIQILQCFQEKNYYKHNCAHSRNAIRDVKIEINKRFGIPFFIPVIALICCFLLSSRKDKKNLFFNKYVIFIMGFITLISSEITVRYSGISTNHTIIYYLIPILLLPLIYIFLITKFKYENLQ